MSDVWYYTDKNGQVGPLTLQELKETLATFATANASDVLVWRDGFPDWKPARDIVELGGQTPLPPPLPGEATHSEFADAGAQKDVKRLLCSDSQNKYFGQPGWIVRAIVVIGGLVLLSVFVSKQEHASNSDRVSESIARTSAEQPSLPADQARFIAIIEQARRDYNAGSNDMAKGAARPACARAICAAFASTAAANGWIGKVAKLSTNNDGRGVLAVEIGKDVWLKTWNNAVADVGDNTLIQPESELYRKAIALRVGQWIAFSGNFLRGTKDCIREGSLTMSGAMTEPEFIFRFYDLVPRS
jgi:GYF domain 2